MKRIFLILGMVGLSFCANAQDDPVVMHINGQPVTRSEFEYNYNKNNNDGVIDKKTVEEYAELFVNYKFKVQAALDAHLDTLSSFQKEFKMYRDQQIRPLLVPTGAVDNECKKYYDQMVENMGGKDLYQAAHIFLFLRQDATKARQDSVKAKIDSIYQALQAGANFEEMAQKYSQDPQTAQRGGVLPWLSPNQALKEFEDAAYALKPGEYSGPIQTAIGYHIVKLLETKPLDSYDVLKPRIQAYFESQGLEDKLATQVLDSMSQHSTPEKTVEEILDEETQKFCAKDNDLKYLVQEYHDGLLLFEECNREVWLPASKDTTGIVNYFKKHKKQYAWKEPHYMGMVYNCKNQADVKAVQKLLKGVLEDKWTSTTRDKFNKDSVTVRMERRLFKVGENETVDALALKVKGKKPHIVKGYEYPAVIGKVLKKGPSKWTDVSNQVVSDYQREKEDEFVAQLRKRYTYDIDKEALKTVNNH